MLLVYGTVISHPQPMPTPVLRADQMVADAVTARLKLADSSDRKLQVNMEGHVADEDRLKNGLLSSRRSLCAAELFDFEQVMGTWESLFALKSRIEGMFTARREHDCARSATRTDRVVTVLTDRCPAVTRVPAERSITAVPHRCRGSAQRHRCSLLDIHTPVECFTPPWF